MVLHGRESQEGVMTRGPSALEGFVSRVQLHVVVQSPFLTEGALAQITLKLPTTENI